MNSHPYSQDKCSSLNQMWHLLLTWFPFSKQQIILSGSVHYEISGKMRRNYNRRKGLCFISISEKIKWIIRKTCFSINIVLVYVNTHIYICIAMWSYSRPSSPRSGFKGTWSYTHSIWDCLYPTNRAASCGPESCDPKFQSP